MLLRALPGLCATFALLLSACGTFEKDPTSKWDADRLLTEARGEMAISSWVRAREYLEKLETRFPFTRHAQQAQMEIAYTYYKEGESAQAITAADRFIKLNPNHPNIDYVYYIKGLASFNDDLGLFGRALGQDPTTRDPKAMREAFDVFRELASRYPDSRYTVDARARMNWLVNALAHGGGTNPDAVKSALADLHLLPTIRAEALSLSQWIALADKLSI
jgi:outer membrane protein assembly factor BamD